MSWKKDSTFSLYLLLGITLTKCYLIENEWYYFHIFSVAIWQSYYVQVNCDIISESKKILGRTAAVCLSSRMEIFFSRNSLPESKIYFYSQLTWTWFHPCDFKKSLIIAYTYSCYICLYLSISMDIFVDTICSTYCSEYNKGWIMCKSIVI